MPDSHHRHRIFINTYLGQGANEARTRFYNQLVLQRGESSSQNHIVAKDACLPLHLQENVTVNGIQGLLVGRYLHRDAVLWEIFMAAKFWR